MTTAANSAPVDLSPVLGSASGIGLATFDGEQVLDVWYPAPCLGSDAIDVSGVTGGIDNDESLCRTGLHKDDLAHQHARFAD